MTLYCQDCGEPIVDANSPQPPSSIPIGVTCPACGSVFRQLPGQTDDEFLAWFAFKTEPSAA